MADSDVKKPVMFPPGRASPATNPSPTGSVTVDKYDWDRPRLPQEGRSHRRSLRNDQIRMELSQLFRERADPIDVGATPSNLHLQVAAARPPQFRKRLCEPGKMRLPLGVAFIHAHQHTDPSHMTGVLSARHERPRRRTAQQRDDFPPPHEHLRRKSGPAPGGVKHERVRYAIGPPSASSDLSYWRFTGLRTGRRARTRLPEGTRIVGHNPGPFPARRVAHSITSSARARSVGGMVRPRAFAVLRLMTNSNLVG